MPLDLDPDDLPPRDWWGSWSMTAVVAAAGLVVVVLVLVLLATGLFGWLLELDNPVN